MYITLAQYLTVSMRRRMADMSWRAYVQSKGVNAPGLQQFAPKIMFQGAVGHRRLMA